MKEKNNIVKKSNDLIANARYELTITQQKLILFVMCMIRVEDDDFKTYVIPVSEIMERMGVSDSLYSRIKTESRDLMKKVFTIEERNAAGKKVQTTLSWFSSIQYVEGSGSVQVRFDPGLKSFLLHLKGRFTTYMLDYVLAMRSSYSVRIYELLKMELAFHHKKDFGLEEFKTLLQIDQKPAFAQYGNIKARILLPAMKEITKNTDIQIIRFKERKRSRKVIGFSLIFGLKPSQEREAICNNYRAMKSIRNINMRDTH
jgi:plasmid replication initiation protein